MCASRPIEPVEPAPLRRTAAPFSAAAGAIYRDSMLTLTRQVIYGAQKMISYNSRESLEPTLLLLVGSRGDVTLRALPDGIV